jgi:hypothetical protein
VDCKGGAFALEFEDYKMAYRAKSAEVEKESRQSFTGCEWAEIRVSN